MIRASAIVAIAVGAILISPAGSLAQSTSGAAGSGSAASGVADRTRHQQRRHRAIVGRRRQHGAGCDDRLGGIARNGNGATPQTSTDAAINEENKTIDRKLNSICRGC